MRQYPMFDVRPKFNDKPIMEFRNLVHVPYLVVACLTLACLQLLLIVVVVSIGQYMYWRHRREQIIQLMMSNVQWRNRPPGRRLL